MYIIKVVLLGEEHLQGNLQHFELALQKENDMVLGSEHCFVMLCCFKNFLHTIVYKDFGR